MPLFFFHIMTPIERIADTEGVELKDLEAARREAIEGLRSIIATEVRHGKLGLDEWIEIADADGKPVLTVRSGDAISLAGGKDSKRAAVVELRLGR